MEQNLYKILLTMSSFLSISYENKKYSIFHLFSQFSKDNIISFDNIFHIKIQLIKKNIFRIEYNHILNNNILYYKSCRR
ncbi:hypothetical protein PFNF135_03202 [Plasmodium falciparum NF135/5.C10]|uniref:Uncharacterized protein n=1 Tax=Plasmodium falciparum NF135/5.C10 TaxID=1036726 RepID=W4IFQ0_PLAFA|nr:hypothetical protein PFNF135_03202 [Plasmodium falciparum NF135/5.C10]